MLSGIDWAAVGTTVRGQQSNREIHAPTISLYRWWARRPHSLIGSLLDAVVPDPRSGYVVADPFSGGGTVAIEAARRGLAVYAQDLHPWAATGLSIALDRVDPDELQAGAELLIAAMGPVGKQLYWSTCPTHCNASEVVQTFWVRVLECPCCRAEVYTYPYPLISKASRNVDERWGYFGCGYCGSVTRSRLASDATQRRCCQCRRRLGSPDRNLLAGREATCRRCGEQFAAFDEDLAGRWTPCLEQRVCPEGVHFEITGNGSDCPAGALGVPEALTAEIPAGEETSLLRRGGFRRWADLYPPRQLQFLLRAAAEIDRLPIRQTTRTRLRLAVCGAAEMAGFASRWDRYYPKAFEFAANHRFSLVGFSCETNLIGSRGRGTLQNRLRASVRAARWVIDTFPEGQSLRMRRTSEARRSSRKPAVVCGSSERLLMTTNYADLVLTDPIFR